MATFQCDSLSGFSRISSNLRYGLISESQDCSEEHLAELMKYAQQDMSFLDSRAEYFYRQAKDSFFENNKFNNQVKYLQAEVRKIFVLRAIDKLNQIDFLKSGQARLQINESPQADLEKRIEAFRQAYLFSAKNADISFWEKDKKKHDLNALIDLIKLGRVANEYNQVLQIIPTVKSNPSTVINLELIKKAQIELFSNHQLKETMKLSKAELAQLKAEVVIWVKSAKALLEVNEGFVKNDPLDLHLRYKVLEAQVKILQVEYALERVRFLEARP